MNISIMLHNKMLKLLFTALQEDLSESNQIMQQNMKMLEDSDNRLNMILAVFVVWTILLTIGIVIMIVVLAYRFSLLYKRMSRARSNISYIQKSVKSFDSQVKETNENEVTTIPTTKKKSVTLARLHRKNPASETGHSQAFSFYTMPSTSLSAHLSNDVSPSNIDKPKINIPINGASSF